MTIRPLDSVRDETAYRFELLERERPGVGHRFLDDMAGVFKQLELDARFYPLVDDQPFGGAFRQALVLHSTYRIIFEIRATDVVVVSLIHTHRRPGAWHRSLGEHDCPSEVHARQYKTTH